MAYSSRRIIAAGFGSILLLLILMTAIGLHNLSMINENVSEIVHMRNIKIDLISKMRNIARERSLSLYHMVMSRDSFVTDHEKIKMSNLAGQFIAARDQLLDFQMQSNEKQMIELALEFAYSSTRIQRQVIAMMEEEKFDAARLLLVEESIPAQNQLLSQYDVVLDIQQEMARQTANSAAATYERSHFTLLMLGGIMTAIAVLVSIIVLIRTSHIEQKSNYLNALLEKRVEARTSELLRLNKELESFSYAVSHDLRAPIRSMIGFSQILREDYADKLDATGMDYMERICNAGIKMNELIEAILKISRLTSRNLDKQTGNLSNLVKSIANEIQDHYPDKKLNFEIQENLSANYDKSMLRVALLNLLDNAVKFSSSRDMPIIEFGCKQTEQNPQVFYVRDYGVGFDMQYADRLFGAFQRLHSASEYEGTGIGLATVARIIHRHHGEIWAEAEIDQGATFYFTLADSAQDENSSLLPL